MGGKKESDFLPIFQIGLLLNTFEQAIKILQSYKYFTGVLGAYLDFCLSSSVWDAIYTKGELSFKSVITP